MKNFIIRWFLAAITGQRIAYWIDNNAEQKILDLAKTEIAGAGAVLALVRTMGRLDVSFAEYTVGDWIVTVKHKDHTEVNR